MYKNKCFYPVFAAIAILSSFSSFAQERATVELKQQPQTRLPIPQKYLAADGNKEALPGRRSPGVVVHRNILYVVGGHIAKKTHGFDKAGYFSSSFQSYDIEKRQWKELPEKPNAGSFPSIIAYQDYLYVFGGFYLWKSYDIVDRFDIKNNKWETLAAKMPHPRSQHSAVEFGGKVYLIGGWDGSKARDEGKHAFYSDIDVFNLKTGQFEESTFKMPGEVRRGSTSQIWNNRIVITGGFDQTFNFLASVYAFDPKKADNQAWELLPPLPAGMIFPMVGKFKNELHLLGGTTGEQPIETGYVLRTGSNIWEKTNYKPDHLASERKVVYIDENTSLLVAGQRNDKKDDEKNDILTDKVDIVRVK